MVRTKKNSKVEKLDEDKEAKQISPLAEVVPEVPSEEPVQEKGMFIMFSSQHLHRFQIENNQALVFPSQLKDNEKFVVKNNRNFIEVVEPSHTYLL